MLSGRAAAAGAHTAVVSPATIVRRWPAATRHAQRTLEAAWPGRCQPCSAPASIRMVQLSARAGGSASSSASSPAPKGAQPLQSKGAATPPAGPSSPPPAAAAKKKTIFPKGAHQRDFRVWLDREKGNKVVTRITEVNGWKLPPGKEDYLKEISKALKQKCGAGGAVKMDTWEVLVQGDHREVVLKALAEWGHMAKKSGG